MRICPVTGSNNWLPFFSSKSGRIMTGDQRIGEGNLEKIICSDSGVVANKSSFTPEELELLYGEKYELNTLGKEEHFFFTQQGPVSRSEVFFDWISPHLPSGFNTLVEIGCGEGNLLARFVSKFSDKNMLGLDGSHKAALLATAKGLNVQQRVINGEEIVPGADVFLLINVIEHIEDIPLLIASLKNALAAGGRIIFCLPIQDYGGYDIFFAEHVWHFTAHHFKTLLEKNGLNIVYSNCDHPINHGIGLFVCEKSEKQLRPAELLYSDVIKNNLIIWEKSFEDLNNYIAENNYQKVAIFGAGEVATLFLTFTLLGGCNVIACIDDTKASGKLKHGIPVHDSEWLKVNKVDCLMLATNKKYHESIRSKFKGMYLNIHSIY